MCLLLPCRTGFFDNLIAELLSQNNISGPCCVHFTSSKILLSQIRWQAHAAAAINYASVVDKVTTGCFFEDQETAAPLKRKT